MTEITPPALPPAGTSQADVFKQMGSAIGLDPATISQFAGALSSAQGLRPRLTGNVQQDIQNDIIKTGGRNIGSITSAYQTPLQNQQLQTQTDISSQTAPYDIVSKQLAAQKAVATTQPFTMSIEDLSGQIDAARKDGKNPQEISKYLQSKGIYDPTNQPKNAQELQQAINSINKLRAIDIKKDAPNQYAHKDIIESYYDNLIKGLDPSGVLKQTAGQEATRSSEDQYNYKIAKGNLESMLTNFKEIPFTGPVEGKLSTMGPLGQFVNPKGKEYEAQLNSMALGGLKNVQGGQGSGLRVNLPEITQWATLLPDVKKTTAQNEYDVKVLNQLVTARFGQGLDPKILAQYGVKSDQNKSYLQKTAANVLPDIKATINGVAGLPGQLVQETVKSGGVMPALGNMAVKAGIGYAKNLNQDLGQPLQGGDIVGRAAQNFQNRPVGTALDLIPGLGLLGKISKGAKVADIAAGDSSSILPKISSTVKNAAESTNELLSGGGPKSLIAKNVNLDDAQSLSKTLLDKDILSAPTAKGKIIRTQQALNDTGLQLQKAFTNSKVTIPAKTIGDNIQNLLLKKYGDKYLPEITQIKNAINNKGEFDLASNTNKLSMNDVWQLRKNGDEYGKVAYNMPGSGPLLKDMSKDVTGYLRSVLNDKVPEARTSLRQYGNLKTYADDVLTDPQGMNIKDIGGLVKFVSGNVQNFGGMLSQKAYNLANKALPDIKASISKPISNGVSSRYNPPGSVKYEPVNTPHEGAQSIPKVNRSIKYDLRYKKGTFKQK